MEIDLREVPEAGRLDRVLAAFGELGSNQVLTLLCDESPASIADSVQNVLGNRADVQTMRWGLEDLAWVMHVKKSLKPSSHHPADG